MTEEYITSEEYLPDELGEETTIQITDKETKEIFVTQARVSDDSTELSNPDVLTVVRGPHENIKEEWYIEILERDLDAERLAKETIQKSIKQSREKSNIVSARSEDIRALLTCLVHTGEYQSVSDAVRSILREHVLQEHPDLVDEYVEAKTELEQKQLATELGRGGEK